MKILKEIFTIFIAGIVPILISFSLGGGDLVVDVATGLMTNDWVLHYTMIVAIIFVVVAWLDHMILYKNEIAEKIHSFIASVLSDAANTFVGFLRVASGIYMTCIALWAFTNFDVDVAPSMLRIFLFGVAAMAECIVLSHFLNHVNKNWLREKY